MTRRSRLLIALVVMLALVAGVAWAAAALTQSIELGTGDEAQLSCANGNNELVVTRGGAGSVTGTCQTTTTTSTSTTTTTSTLPPPPPTTTTTTTTLPPAPPTSWPSAANTGPTSAMTLVSGNVTLSTPGQVYSGFDVAGYIRVTAANVTLRNFHARDGVRFDAPGGLLEDCDLGPASGLSGGPNGLGIAVGFSNYTIRRCDVP